MLSGETWFIDMDDADVAESKIECTIADSLAQVRRRMEYRELEAVHACHWCGEFIADMRLFCCAECGSDWSYEKDRRKALGI